jgi:hypothetical protein
VLVRVPLAAMAFLHPWLLTSRLRRLHAFVVARQRGCALLSWEPRARGNDEVQDQPLPDPIAERRARRRQAIRTRRRYKVVRWVAATLGAAAVVLAIWAASGSAAAVSSSSVAVDLVIVLVAATVPWLAVEALWRRTLRRNYWEWQ